jgi:hypothetical protein
MNDIRLSDVIQIPKSSRSYARDDKWVLPECHIGIELELENAQYLMALIEEHSVAWKTVEDASLRNRGYEFILSEPLSGLDLTKAIEEIKTYINLLYKKGGSFVPDPHYRTSSHVHIDIRDCTTKQYMNIVLLGILFEPALFKMAGEQRQRNNFSMGSRFSTGYFDDLSSAYNAKTWEEMQRYLQLQFKYSAINVTPPFINEQGHRKKGSIEFRHHAGCIDMDKIYIWINILMCIKKAALDDALFSVDWMYDLSSGKLLKIIKEIFGDYSVQLIYEGINDDCLEGARLVQEIMYSKKIKDDKELAILDAKLHPPKPKKVV